MTTLQRLEADARALAAEGRITLGDAVDTVCEAYGCTTQIVQACSPRHRCAQCKGEVAADARDDGASR